MNSSVGIFIISNKLTSKVSPLLHKISITEFSTSVESPDPLLSQGLVTSIGSKAQSSRFSQSKKSTINSAGIF